MFSPDLDTLSSLDRETIDFEVWGGGGGMLKEKVFSQRKKANSSPQQAIHRQK